MTLQPLTHHDILALVEPFTRLGRHVDLSASNRAERRLVFKPVIHDGRDTQALDACSLHEELQLESFGTGTCRLTRTLTHPSGLQATLEAMGQAPQVLLAVVNATAPQHQFHSGAGFMVARSYATQTTADAETAGRPAPPLALRRGVVQVDGLCLVMTVSAVRGVSADLMLTQTSAGELLLPEDLLAVLGWDWARLIHDKLNWKSKLRLRGGTARRSRSAEAALDRAAAHLARTLAEPPGRFHERHLAARRGVVLRRAIPLLTPVLLFITVLALPRFDVESSPLWVLLYHVPTVFILLSFRLQELPQFEIPPWPRRSGALAWRQAQEAAAAGGQPSPTGRRS
jgi:hypothetical protein